MSIVGAGFIGLEVAASCRARGLPVTVIESLPIPLSPIVGPLIGDMVAAMHRDHGVDLRTGVVVTDVLGESRVAGVALRRLGSTPTSWWSASASLQTRNGSKAAASRSIPSSATAPVKPHQMCMPPASRVVNRWHGDHRESSIGPTRSSRQHAAENALAGPEASTSFSSVPYFWSDQHDRKIQFIGGGPHDEIVIVDGSLADRRLTALYRRGDRLVACLALNQPRALLSAGSCSLPANRGTPPSRHRPLRSPSHRPCQGVERSYRHGGRAAVCCLERSQDENADTV